MWSQKIFASLVFFFVDRRFIRMGAMLCCFQMEREREVSADGGRHCHFLHGDIKQVMPDGRVVGFHRCVFSVG